MTFAPAGTIIISPSENIICIGILFQSDLFLSMFNCFYSLSRFCSDVCDLLICTFDAYFIKLFRISYGYEYSVVPVGMNMTRSR